MEHRVLGFDLYCTMLENRKVPRGSEGEPIEERTPVVRCTWQIDIKLPES